MNPLGFSPRYARSATLCDKVFFHLSKTRHHMKHHFPGWRTEVESFPKADNFNAFRVEGFNCSQNINGIASEAVNGNYNKYVAFTSCFDSFIQGGALLGGNRTANPLIIKFEVLLYLITGFLNLTALVIYALIVG